MAAFEWIWQRVHDGNMLFRPRPNVSFHEAMARGIPLLIGGVMQKRGTDDILVSVYRYRYHSVSDWEEEVLPVTFTDWDEAKKYCETVCRLEAA